MYDCWLNLLSKEALDKLMLYGGTFGGQWHACYINCCLFWATIKKHLRFIWAPVPFVSFFDAHGMKKKSFCLHWYSTHIWYKLWYSLTTGLSCILSFLYPGFACVAFITLCVLQLELLFFCSAHSTVRLLCSCKPLMLLHIRVHRQIQRDIIYHWGKNLQVL